MSKRIQGYHEVYKAAMSLCNNLTLRPDTFNESGDDVYYEFINCRNKVKDHLFLEYSPHMKYIAEVYDELYEKLIKLKQV